MKSATPSALARSVAAQLWPDVHMQKKLCRGAYGFSCAGHGGLIGIVSELDLAPEVVEAGRKCGLVATVARINQGRRIQTCVSGYGYTRERLTKLKDGYPHAVELIDVWIGEEDCGWATLCYVAPQVLSGALSAGFFTSADETEVYRVVRSWHEDLLAALDPEYVPEPDGQIEMRARHDALIEAGEVILASAIGIGDDLVRVTFCGEDRRKEFYTMSSETYERRREFPMRYDLTPADFRKFGEITRVNEEVTA